MSVLLKNILIEKVDKVNSETDYENREGGWFDVDEVHDKSHEILSEAIFEYISNTSSQVLPTSQIVTTATGVSVVGGVGSPLSDIITTTDISMGSLEALKSAIFCNTQGTETVEEGIVNLFKGISAWLNMGWLAHITVGTLLNPLTGDGPILFPTMESMGPLCYSSLISETPETYIETNAIITRYIHQGFTSIFIAPVPTTGTVVACGVFTGMSTVVWTFN